MSSATIDGQSIIGTIEGMGALGTVGQEVLTQYNVGHIHPEKQYSYRLRRAIHEAAFKRFGEAALYSFGAFTIDHFPDFLRTFRDTFLEFSNASQNSNKKQDSEKRALEKIVQHMAAGMHESFQRGVVNGSGEYGCWTEPIEPQVFRFTQCSTSTLQHEAFVRGVTTAMMISTIGDLWQVDMEYDPDGSSEGDDWARISFILRLNKLTNKEDEPLATKVARFQKAALDKLLANVFAEADRQKIAAENQKQRFENLADNLAKYLPPQIHEALFEGKYDTGITTRRKKLTIFFSDIKNFTATSEDLQPEDLTYYLNEYFSEMTSIALENGATIDKYIGDAMMVFFGDPDSNGERDDARACVEMALQMQEKMTELQQRWRNRGFANPFEIRIGLNTGYCNVGNFGSDQRLTYTIIGGEVNVAQRLETNAPAGGILMSYETYAHAQDMIEVDELETIRMKGINRAIKIFSVISRKVDKPSFEEEGVINDKNVKDSQPGEEKMGAEFQYLLRELQSIKKTLNRIPGIEKELKSLGKRMVGK